MSLRDIDIKTSYVGKGIEILNKFLMPSLSNSIQYDRITGYYTIDSLISIANGIDSLRRKKGKMRLVVGVHSIPGEIIDAVIYKDKLKQEIDKVNQEVTTEIKKLSDILDKKRIVTVAWMIEEGLLCVKAASVKGEGIFHPKTIIFKDEDGNEIAAMGSPNETKNGLGGNFEQLAVWKSWKDLDGVQEQKNFFERLWNNQQNDAIVVDITEETAKMIKESLGNEYNRIKDMMKMEIDDGFEKMSKMPLNFFVSGSIPALFMHQERAVIDALSRWPVRVLFSDEVGLGKTFEAASTMTFLHMFCGVKRIIILTPKSVLKQWQDELKNNFGLEVWMFDSSKRQYISSNNRTINMEDRNPLGYGSPNIILMSAQFARGFKGECGLLSEKDTLLPDLLVVDEAHSARISKDISGNKKKTQMYKMVEAVQDKIPHLILATATPMQKDALEYHAMLKLLGLPKIWQKEQNFLDSLRYITSDSIDDLSDANKIFSLLHFTYKMMSPQLKEITENEKRLLQMIERDYKVKDNFSKADFIRKEWPNLKKLFIKIHPARLLTIRNTRRSLTEVGYKFPKRNLHELSLYESNKIKSFYSTLNDYLTHECFLVEESLFPDRKMNTGFIKISYQQRMASSLYSCKRSLENRLTKLERIKSYVNKPYMIGDFSEANFIDIDDYDEDDLLFNDYISDSKEIRNAFNLEYALNKEILSIKSLLNEVSELLNSQGDQKIDESIDLAITEIQKGKVVLLFTRYTDTVTSLVTRFQMCGESTYNYAIYTGNQALMIIDGVEKSCDKNEIKEALFDGVVKVVFCSDAASEGLNLQAAQILINVDVPWTPARLEQRIGRIARLGQIADEVDIYNVWYPDSVEAKMYHRIQSRLKESNIAIGEFPEVVSENIKSAILNNEPDDSVEMLKNIRNNLQKDALEELWTSTTEQSHSDLVREELIKACIANFEIKECDLNKKEYVFKTGDGKFIQVEGNPGSMKSIHLNSKILENIDSTLYGLALMKKGDCLIGLENPVNGQMVMTEDVIEHIVNKSKSDYEYYDGYPAILPNPNRLNLKYSVNNLNLMVPVFWADDNDKEILK